MWENLTSTMYKTVVDRENGRDKNDGLDGKENRRKRRQGGERIEKMGEGGERGRKRERTVEGEEGKGRGVDGFFQRGKARRIALSVRRKGEIALNENGLKKNLMYGSKKVRQGKKSQQTGGCGL